MTFIPATVVDTSKPAAVEEPKEEVVEAAPSEENVLVDETGTNDPAPQTTEEKVAEYVANKKYKFTAEDGEKEEEFEEWVAPLLSKDTEDKFRDLFSRSKGMEYIKKSRDKERQEKAALKSEFDQLDGVVSEILDLREKDLGKFFARLKLDENKVAQYLIQKAEVEDSLKDVPEPLKKMYTHYQELQAENELLKRGSDSATEASLNASAKAMDLEIKTVLAHPSISSAVSEYETRRNKPGAFYEQVVREGEAEYFRSKKVLSAEEAVKRAIETLALTQAPSQGATPNGSATPKVITQAKPTVIPNVGSGSNSAPVVKRPKNLDELRALAKEAQSAA